MMRFFPLFLFSLLMLCVAWQDFAQAAGGVPSAVWQDSDRNHRRSPPQIINQITPQTHVGNIALPETAQQQRLAKVRNTIGQNWTITADNSQLPMLEDGDWRLKILPAAIAHSENVRLGEIAQPLGRMEPGVWENLELTELWAAPPEGSKPLQINKTRLSQALREALGPDYAARCILPTSLVIQRGGAVFSGDDLRNYVVKSLAPQMAAMPGEAELGDFRLPEYIFLANTGQQVQLEPGKLAPGRVPLRFAIQEADGTVLRRVAGTCKLTLWITAPHAARPVNKGQTLSTDDITFMRTNAAQMKDVPWDGQGGPWQVIRSIGKGEPILQSDLASKLMVRRGNILTLNYARGNVRMTLQAEALADGEPGQTIPVRNLQTKKQVYATVKDGSTVEIH